MWLGNKQLAQGRAMKVSRHLENMGVASKQLELEVFADQVLLVPEPHCEGNAANRRVELRMLERVTADEARGLKFSEDMLLKLACLAAGIGVPMTTGLRTVFGEVLASWGLPWGNALPLLHQQQI